MTALAVSIRAPIRGPGRLCFFGENKFRIGFNPRPDPRTGATQMHAMLSGIGLGFNPRPDPRTGATDRICKADAPTRVSIRAPIRGPGRLDLSLVFPSIASFNPRPDPRTGATVGACLTFNGKRVSIRAPIRGPGRLVDTLNADFAAIVSIRAPIRGPGRPEIRACIGIAQCFNPRPDPRTGAT